MRAALSLAALASVGVLVVAGPGALTADAAASRAAPREAETPRARRAAWIRAVEEHADRTFHWAHEDGAFVGSTSGGAFELRGDALYFGGPGAPPLGSIRTTSVGRDAAGASAAVRDRRAEGNAVRFERTGGVVEHWVHGPLGVEHTLELAERPAGAGPLVVELEVAGLVPRATDDGRVTLADGTGRERATYAELFVLDAARREIPSHLEVEGASIHIVVDDDDARYPLLIDPLVGIVEARLDAPTPGANDEFGWALALDGDTAIVGAPRRDTARGSDAGAAYVFVRSGTTWTLQAVLEAADGSPSAYFGCSIALAGDTAVIGSYFASLGAGAAYVFTRTGTVWSQTTRIEGSDPTAGGYFGASVAFEGSRVIVGAPRQDTADGVDAGRVYVFSLSGSTWSELIRFESSEGTPNAHLGASVAISGSTFVAGAPDADSGARGAAHVIVESSGSFSETVLRASDAAAGDAFGTSVAIVGDTVLVGARGDDNGRGTDAGSAYVFTRAGPTWSEEARLEASSGAASDFFGNAVALTPDRALVGAPNVDRSTFASDSGAAYLFTRSGTLWTQVASVETGESPRGDLFAWALALSGDTLVGGAPGRNGSAVSDIGVAYVLRLRSVGQSCSAAGDCPSGFCVDGVCCASACGAGLGSDCQACSVAAGGTSDGLCTALSTTAAPSTICRTSAGACDRAETCTAGATACPADAREPTTTACRAFAGPCDVVEYCDGTSVGCGPDARRGAGFTCRASAGACDPAEACDGTGITCPGDVIRAAGTVCNPALGPCDVAEVCDGTSAACPTPIVAAAETVCRASAGGCDPDERCDGTSTACPADARSAAGTVCGAGSVGLCGTPGVCDGLAAGCPGAMPRAAGAVCVPAEAGNPCDVDDVCDGATDVCQPRFADATVACGATPTEVCDAADHCSGTSADCVAVYLSGVECRASSGGCDIPEACLGDAPACPPDALLPSGTTCRASIDLVCDPTEVCDGTSTACPADVMTCGSGDAGPTDGGARDAGDPLADSGPSGADAALGADVGFTPAATAGCACRATRHAPSSSGLLIGVAVALALGARRRPRAIDARARRA